MPLEFQSWSERLYQAVAGLSRTAHGVTEEAYGGNKPALALKGDDLRSIVDGNLRRAISYVWNYGPAIRQDPVHVQSFINAVATKVSHGLVPDASLLRTWDTREKYLWQTPPEAVATEYRELCREIAKRIPLFVHHPIDQAAWVERELDWRIHPFSDGCGRTTKLVGAWVLLRGGLMPARFPSSKEYYKHIHHPEQEWVAFYQAHVQ